MPDPSSKSKKTRGNTAVPQNTTFRFVPKLAPTSAKTDNRLPVDTNTSASRKAEGLGLLGDTITNIVQTKQQFKNIDARKAKEQEAAEADFNKRQEKLTGQRASADSVRLKNAASNFIRDRVRPNMGTENQLTPDEINGEWGSLLKKFTDGKDTNYINSFLPQAEKTEIGMFQEVNEIHHAQLVDDRLQDTSLIIEDRVDSMLTTVSGLSNLGEATLDPESFSALGSSLIDNADVVAQEVRTLMSEAQESNGDIADISKSQVSLETLSTLENMSTKAGGVPELFDAFTKPDSNGIILSNSPEFRDKVESAVQRAQSLREDTADGLEKKAEVDFTAGLNEWHGSVVDEFDNLTANKASIPAGEYNNRVNSIENQLTDLNKTGRLSYTQFRQMDNMVNTLRQPFPAESNPQTFRQLEFDVISGNAGLDEVLEASDSLSSKDFSRLIRDADTPQTDKTLWDNKAVLKEGFDVLDAIVPTGELGAFKNADGSRTKALFQARRAYMRRFKEFRSKNPDAVWPDYLEVAEDIFNKFAVKDN